MKNFIEKNKDMIMVALTATGIICTIKFGKALMELDNVWLGFLGIGVSILGLIGTGIFLYKSTPVFIKQAKILLKK